MVTISCQSILNYVFTYGDRRIFIHVSDIECFTFFMGMRGIRYIHISGLKK